MSQTSANSRQKRSRTGCMNCRRKKKKCDEGKPTCFNCVRTSEKCIWSRPLSFLPQNAFTINESDPRALSMSNLNECLDHQADSEDGVIVDEDTTLGNFDEAVNETGRGPLDGPIQVFHATTSTFTPPAQSLILSQPVSATELDAQSPLSPTLTISPSAGVQYSTHRPHRRNPGESFEQERGMDLDIVDASATNMTFDPSSEAYAFTQPVRSGSEFPLSPDVLTDDGIFLPGSTYQELHATLRQHVFSTARSRETSRQQSPTLVPDKNHARPSQNTIPRAISDADDIGLDESEVTLSPDQEYILWKNWADEIADWLDKFDTERHFARTLPVMAKTCSHLRYSMLALSARQLERKNKSIAAPLTLSLYSAAVRQLIPQLYRKDTYVLASCVINCVLEMMSCSPRAWRRHLDGCASLIRSMNIHADSTGIERALFWCFIRMDVCGGLISKERTLIPISEWTSQPTFEHAVAFFISHSTVDSSAGFSCYLLSCVLDLLFASLPLTSPGTPNSQRQHNTSYTERWKELFAIIENWYDIRPPEMLPIVSYRTVDDQPFPIILFGSGAAISGNQLHHTAALLMLQNIPRNVKRPSSHSILWHARRICGITACNDHHGCWTNSVQPLWLAGQVMSHNTEHRAIVDIYARIERETGWGATWRADDLKQFWGTDA